MFKSKWNGLLPIEKRFIHHLYENYFKDKDEILDINKMYKEIKEYYDDSVTWSYFKKMYNLLIETVNNPDFKLYEGLIQLSEDRTILDITVNIDPEEYWLIAEDYFEDFEQLTGEEIFTEGRSARHIVVENNARNFINFKELRDLQQSLQKDFIEEVNRTGVEKNEDI